MRLILARHGETIWNREGRCQGFSDIELTPEGVMQAQALARSLEEEQIEAVYSSSLKRAFDTAEIIAQPHHLEVQREDDLREINQGELEGLRYHELRDRYAPLLAAWRVRPAQVRMPGGESLEDVQKRAWSVILRIVRAHPKGNVLVVAHGLTNRAILCKALEMDLEEFRRVDQDTATKNIIEFHYDGGEERIVVTLLNDVCHLKLFSDE